MSFVHHDKLYVATYKEIVLAFITFSILLVVLYPKDFLQKQILNERSNYDLSMLYLKNMLKNDPDNESLMLTLAKQSFKTGNKDLSIELLSLLQHSQNQQVKDETNILAFRIQKDNYFYLESINSIVKLQETYEKLKVLMKLIVLIDIDDEEELKSLYQEANFLNDAKSSYIFVKRILISSPDNLRYNKAAYYLANKLGERDKAMAYLNKVISLDPANTKEWMEAKYYLHLDASSYEETETFLKKKALESIFWEKKLASFYEFNQKYERVSSMNMEFFEKTTSKKKKRYYWLKAVNALMYGGHSSKAVALGYKYENYFINDKKARIELLKLYISSNKLHRASSLSKKILKRKLY